MLKAIIKNCRSNIPLALEVPLYRGGLEIMYSGSDGYKRVISQFTNHLKFLRAELNTQQVSHRLNTHQVSKWLNTQRVSQWLNTHQVSK